MSILPTQGEPELVELRQTAMTLAEGRRERLNSAHLLVAMVDQASSGACELLRERKLTRDTLLKAARSSSDDEHEPVRAAVLRAREVARGMRAPETTALHLLVALLRVRNCAAFRALDQCGVDIHRLRTTAMELGLRRAERAEASPPPPAPVTQRSTPARRSLGKAVSVPLMLPVRPAAAPKPAAEAAKVVEPPAAPVERGAAVQVTPAMIEPVAPKASDGRKPRKRAARKSNFALDAKRFALLNRLGRNLCLEAESGRLPQVVERAREVEQLLDVLAKREANNPCLVGLPGVGKTSLVYALVHRIVSGSVAASDERIVLQLSVSDLLSGAAARGSLAQRMAEVKKELAQADGRIVLFFDDVHQLAGAESTEEMIGELRRGIASGALHCIGATTPDDFARVVECDPVLNRHFARVDLDEPELEFACDVLTSCVPSLREHHGIEFSDEAVASTIAWSARYVTGAALPQKAISILDLAGARAGRRGLRNVGAEQVASVVTEITSVPTERLLETDGARMLRLEEALAERVVGHAGALGRIAANLRRNAAGLGGNRPIGTFLLLGPTGVGKTETAKAIAHTLFGSEQALTRLDLSEYSEAHAVARLIGAPPGYVGHEAGGQLTEAVRRKPYQVLLLDEIEKAHQEVLETFLPLFDEGRLTDGRGRTVDFTNTVIILTSNIGAREATGEGPRRLGFGQREGRRDDQRTRAESRVVSAAREALSPEFFNRLDEVLVFEALQSDEVQMIATRLLQKLADLVYEQRDVELSIEPSVVEMLLERGGFDASLGARPMKRAIARYVEAPLAEALLAETFAPGDQVAVNVVDGEVRFARVAAGVAAE